MRTNLWIVIVIVSTFMGFLLGYSLSAYTGVQKGGDYALESGGYGGDESGGYGGDAGGYGGDAGGYGGGGDSAPSTGQALDEEALDYYKNLGQETE